MKKKLIVVFLIIIVLIAVGQIKGKNRDQYVHKTIKATIVGYSEKDGETVIILQDSGLISQTYVVLQENTMYEDDKIESIIKNEEVGAKVCVESEYWVNEVYNDDGPPWFFPVMIIYTL